MDVAVDMYVIQALHGLVYGMLLFLVASGLAGLAGVVAAPFLSTYPGMGLDILIDTFVVIVVGGFGSLMGAFLASIMIGELQSFGVLFMKNDDNCC